MDYNRPMWVSKYKKYGFPVDWADNTLKNYDSELVNNLEPSTISPENLININPQNLIDESNTLMNIVCHEDYPESEILLFSLDLLCDFKKALPEYDSDIYNLYLNLKNTNQLACEFEKFYLFVRRLKNTNIKKSKEYKSLKKAQEKYKYANSIKKDADYIINYSGEKIRVVVTNITKEVDFVIQGTACCQIKEFISDSSSIDMEIGDEILVPLQKFNFKNF